MRRRARAVLLGLVAAGTAFSVPLVRDGDTPLLFQGYVEGDFILVGPEETGRIEHLAVAAGDNVLEGQLVFTLENSMAEARRAEAVARLKQAEAQVANLRASQQRPEQVAVLEASAARARAALDLSRSEFERQQALYERGTVPKVRLDEARSAFERDQAALSEVQRQIEAARLAGRSAEIEAAEAAVRAAEASVRQAEILLGRRRMTAPAAGRVQDVLFRRGEVVEGGQPVIALLPPSNIKVRFYVPEPALAGFGVGTPIEIRCHGCDVGLRARVSFISHEAEYTPPVIFSSEERAKLVFRLEARPEGAASYLPPGLPVTVATIPATALADRSGG